MKKLIFAVAATLLGGTLALSACGGDKPKGEITGKYVEVSGAKLTEKLNKLTAEELFGDTSSKDWSFGLEMTADIGAKIDLKTGHGDSAEQLLKLDATENSTAKAMMSANDGGDGICIKLQNNDKLKGKLYKSDSLGIEKDIDFDYQINVHADGGYVYFQIPDFSDLPLPFEIAEGKFKMPVEYVFSAVADVMPNTLSKAAEGNANETSALLEKYGIKAYVDERDGLKIKLSADQHFLYAILEDAAGMSAKTAEDLATFNTFAVDLYFEASSNGRFERAGLVAKIDGSLTIAAGDLGEDAPALGGTVKLDADIALKRYIGEIILPTEEELSEYNDITAESPDAN